MAENRKQKSLIRLSEIPLHSEDDVSLSRQRSRRMAALAGLNVPDQARFATAVAEIARNAVRHAGGGKVQLNVEVVGRRGAVVAIVSDTGPGIPGLQAILSGVVEAKEHGAGITGARKLVDRFSIESDTSGATVTLGKNIPPGADAIVPEMIPAWIALLEQETSETVWAERQQQTQELAQTLSELRRKEVDLKRQLRKIKQLNQKLDVLSLVASKTDNGVVITDKDGLIEWVNDGFSRITGYDALEVYGKKPGDVLQGPDTDPQTVDRIRKALRDKRSFTEEILNYHKSGRPYWVAMNIFPILDETGHVTRFIAIQSDITRHRESEAELQRAKEAAEAANRAKSEFLANISHEIRTPMNAIIGMTELALSTELSDEQREYLETVRGSSAGLLRLLNDLLDFSKIEAGKLDLERVPFSLRGAVEDALRSVAVKAQEKKLEVACRVASSANDLLLGDPERLRQVLVNLIGNAIRFTDTGEVTVRVEEISRLPGEIVLHFSVADTGIGIAPEQLAGIFQAFRQGDNSAKRRYGGTGLGLTISSQLIEMMDGKIWVESKVGSGSTFHFTARFSLPVATVGIDDGVQPSAALRGVRALVVDDNKTTRQVLAEMLTEWGVDTAAVESPQEAIDAAGKAASEGQPFRYALVDELMPSHDGLEVARCIVDASPETRAVLMIASADRADIIAACRDAGIRLHVSKPVLQSDLLEALVHGVEGRTGVRSRRSNTPLAPPARPLEILLAEDIPANQQLAKRILTRRGHSVSVADNGVSAIAAARNKSFDVILMDVQMPEMDGFEATGAIRKLEKRLGRRTPIIAMTAHAMKGDRERCISAGMDDYLAKPLDAHQLVETIERLAESNGEVIDDTNANAQEDAPRFKFNFQPAIARMDGDLEIFRELAQFFIRDSRQLLEKTRAALDAGDLQSLERHAHSLKGLASNFDATPAIAAARELESMGRNGQLEKEEEAFASLQTAIDELVDALTDFLDTASTSARSAE